MGVQCRQIFDGLDEIGLALPVRPHEGGHARVEVELRGRVRPEVRDRQMGDAHAGLTGTRAQLTSPDPDEGPASVTGCPSSVVVLPVSPPRTSFSIFSPILDPAGVGNGVHVHFSFRDAYGGSATYDPDDALHLSRLARHFAAGLLHHMR